MNIYMLTGDQAKGYNTKHIWVIEAFDGSMAIAGLMLSWQESQPWTAVIRTVISVVS